MVTIVENHLIPKKVQIIAYLLGWTIASVTCTSSKNTQNLWRYPELSLTMVYVSDTKKAAEIKPFWIGQTEVTQRQWEEIMGAEELHPEKPSPFWGQHPNFPKVSISYNDVQQFIEKLNRQTDIKFRLPTKEEWELACAADSSSDFHYGKILSWKDANFNSEFSSQFAENGPSVKRPVPVASYEPNSLGIYDMHGNAYEWTSTKDTLGIALTDEDGVFIIKGGSWAFGADRAKISTNAIHKSNLWGYSVGFRLAADFIQPNKSCKNK